jgi:hypothetical protein
MARFTAIEVINMNAQLQVELALIIKLNAIVANGKEFFVAGQDDPTRDPTEFIFIDLQSLPGHPFTYHHGHPTGGMINAITVDLNAQEQFKFTGLDTSIVLFEKDLEEHRPRAAVELLFKGNDTVTGSSGNDVLWAGDGDNVFVFKGNWGQDVVVDFDAFDKIALAYAQFANYERVVHDSHINSHHQLVIVDPVTHSSITIPSLDEKSDLKPSELLFLHH